MKELVNSGKIGRILSTTAVLELARMTAPPLAAPPGEHAPVKHSESWNPMDVDQPRDHGGPGADHEPNGAPRPPDRAAPGDSADYAPNGAASNGGDSTSPTARSDGVQRGEKIIKVLSRSPLVQFV